MLTDDARPCAQEVIKFCELPPAEGWLELPAGFVRRCGALLRGLLVLYDANLIDTGDGLARAVFEAAVTGVWLLGELDARSERLIRGFRDELGALAKANRGLYQPVLDSLCESMEKMFGDSRGKRMPNVKDRMAPDIERHHLRYKEISSRTQATLVSAALHSGQVAHPFSDGYVPYSAFLTATLALATRAKMGLSYDRLYNLAFALAALNDGASATPILDPLPPGTVIVRPED